jgi:hypothetical protein
MPFQKIQHLFEGGAYGWTETWYFTGTDRADALRAGQELASERMALLGQNVRLMEVQASEEADPTEGTLVKPGNPFVTRGESAVAVPVPKALVADSAADDPWLGALLSILAAPGAAPGGPFYHRGFILRGHATTSYVGIPPQVTWQGAFKQGVTRFGDLLKDLAICLRVAVKTKPELPVIGIEAGPAPESVWLTCPGHTLATGSKVKLTGFGKGVKTYNGVHKVYNTRALPTVAFAIGTKVGILPLPKEGLARLYEYSYVPIMKVVLSEMRKRNTGKSKWVSRAQKKRQKNVI